jgi:streptogramin lyase
VPSRILSRVVGTGLLVAALLAAPAVAAPFVDGEFPVASVDSNTKIAAGPDGNIWLTLAFSAGGKDVARVTPAGEVTEYELEATNPLGITAGPEGNVWITQNGGVTKFSPTEPEASKKFIEENKIIGNHGIVAGPDSNLWVATDGNLVRIEPGTESTKAFPVLGLAPKDIDVAGSLLAIASQERIVTATPADPPVTTDYAISGLASQGVAGSPSGQIAFSDPLATPEQVGLITPPNPAQETELGGDPFGVTFGSDGAFWFARFATGSITRLTSDNQMTELGGFPIEGPRQITAGPGNTLWVTVETKEGGGEEKPDKVVKVSGVEAPPAAPIAGSAPETRIVKGPKKRVKTKRKRARVRFTFRSPNAGAKFECALQKLKKRKKGKPASKPRFKPCKSPKKYRLKPGRYRFLVRAVVGGVADPTPAKRTFRVIHTR